MNGLNALQNSSTAHILSSCLTPVSLQLLLSDVEKNRLLQEKKGKEEYLYSAIYILHISQSAQAWITQFYLQIHHACLSFVSVHQMAPPLTEVRDI